MRIMLELALYYEKNLVTVRSIASSQEISEKYIEQIIAILNRAGLVHSRRGATGGYRLARAPETITVGQILQVTEGDMDVVECIGGHRTGTRCRRSHACVTADVWYEIKRAIENVVDNITMADLVENYHKKAFCKIAQ